MAEKYCIDDSPVAFWAIHAEYAKPLWEPKEQIPTGASYPVSDDGASYPHKKGSRVPFYVLGIYSSEDSIYRDHEDNWHQFLLDEAVRLADEKGLDSKFTRLFVLESQNEICGLRD
jgi:hypothetical protein